MDMLTQFVYKQVNAWIYMDFIGRYVYIYMYVYRTSWTLHTGFAFKQIPFSWNNLKQAKQRFFHPTKFGEVLTVSILGGGATSLRTS